MALEVQLLILFIFLKNGEWLLIIMLTTLTMLPLNNACLLVDTDFALITVLLLRLETCIFCI